MAMTAEFYKQVMRRFATGVMVLTVKSDGEMHALTVNGFTSVSLDPVLLLVCIEKTARSHGLIQQAGAFVLNILTDEQTELGERFAYDRAARQNPAALVQGYIGTTGALIFDKSLGFLECRVTAEYEGGDHTIFLAEVVNADLKNSAIGPLLYYSGRFMSMPGAESDERH